MINNIYKSLIASLCLMFCILWSTNAYAATLSVNSPEVKHINEIFNVSIILDTKGESINAAEGILEYNNSLAEISEIKINSSIISLWVEKPFITNIGNGRGTIRYSGIIPGGYSGSNAQIFSLSIKGTRTGVLSLILKNSNLLLNDKKGTLTSVITINDSTTITTTEAVIGIEDDVISPTPPLSDFEKPESFKLYITNDPNINEGKHTLVFNAHDKGSGISRYEIAETKDSDINHLKWVEANSPYLVNDQSLESDIYVKAIDNAGNFRIEKLERTKRTIEQTSQIENYTLCFTSFVLVVLIICTLLLIKRKFRVIK